MTDDVRIVGPQEGPQELSLESSADIVIYGGSAGGGKSFSLLLEPLRHVGNPNFGAVAFRRTSPQITAEGGLWDTACQIYPALGAAMLTGIHESRFPSGARVSFRHLQHEKDKFNWQGSQIPLLLFDELTHLSASQFWYLLSRNRSTCGVRPYVRATCNPEPGWVFDLIAWWIDANTGLPIKERAGRVRWFIRVSDEMIWADSREELVEQYPDNEPKSLTFIPASLEDNPALMEADPGYKANLLALPRIERERLLYGNWLVRDESIIDAEWLKEYETAPLGVALVFIRKGQRIEAPNYQLQRFATVDTAGTSKEKAAERKGKPPSSSCCGIWDYHAESDSLCLRYMWRKQVDWGGLKRGVNDCLQEFNVPRVYIEDKHFGPALASEITAHNCVVELVPAKLPEMRDSNRDAKLERAIASGLLSRLEFGGMFYPSVDQAPWMQEYRNECLAWSGLPGETSDQIDVSSYAAHFAREQTSAWGGVIR